MNIVGSHERSPCSSRVALAPTPPGCLLEAHCAEGWGRMLEEAASKGSRNANVDQVPWMHPGTTLRAKRCNPVRAPQRQTAQSSLLEQAVPKGAQNTVLDQVPRLHP